MQRHAAAVVEAPPDADWATIDRTASLTEIATTTPGRGSRGNYGNKGSTFHPHTEAFLAALICGIALSFLSVLSDACSHWVSAIRSGICADYFWLGRSMCCVEETECEEYFTWGEFFLGRDNLVRPWVDLTMYVAVSTVAAVLSSFMCKVYAPYAAGGGIAEVKTIVSGHHVRRYLGGWTLATKVLGMCLSTGSGLVVGKEGPFVHIGGCVGGIVSRIFPSYQRASKRSELITAGSGGGMAVAFGAPVGGVIFALEEVSGEYNFKTLMVALICGVTAVLLQSRVDLWHTGRIVQFSVNYRHNWHFFELPLFAAIGCFGGFVGSAFNTVNLKVGRWRRRRFLQWRMTEVAVVAAVTAVVNFVVPYGSGSMLELLGDCFQDCTPGSPIEMCHDGEVRVFLSLLLTATAKFGLYIYTIGIFLPAGLLVPSLTIGALYGRAFGVFFRAIQESYASSYIFAECSDQDICVIPGMYAIVGAAAVLTGVTRMTICLAIIMFELTGSLEYMVPVIIGILCAKASGEALGVPGTYEMGIEENNLPYLDPKKEFHLRYVAEDVYATKKFTVLTAYGLTIGQISTVIHRMNVTGFPVVESATDTTLLGYVPTKRIVHAVQHATAHNAGVNHHTYVRFRKAPSACDDADFLELDLSDTLESCSLQVEPQCPVQKILYYFQALGSHHLVVCCQARFVGFISKKDFIQFMREKEREEHVADGVLEQERLSRERANLVRQQQATIPVLAGYGERGVLMRDTGL